MEEDPLHQPHDKLFKLGFSDPATAAPDLRNTAMTLAQKLRQEGHQEGRSSALQDSILDALDLRHRSVPEGLVEVIRRISEEERLHALLRHALRCDSIEDFTRNL
jgi:hypothetical protein